jgi:hypothetical protein
MGIIVIALSTPKARQPASVGEHIVLHATHTFMTGNKTVICQT